MNVFTPIPRGRMTGYVKEPDRSASSVVHFSWDDRKISVDNRVDINTVYCRAQDELDDKLLESSIMTAQTREAYTLANGWDFTEETKPLIFGGGWGYDDLNIYYPNIYGIGCVDNYMCVKFAYRLNHQGKWAPLGNGIGENWFDVTIKMNRTISNIVSVGAFDSNNRPLSGFDIELYGVIGRYPVALSVQSTTTVYSAKQALKILK